MEYFRPTLINVAGMDPLAWRVTFTGGDNIILSQSMTARTILISATLVSGSGVSGTSTVDSWGPDRPLIAMSRLRGTFNDFFTEITQTGNFVYVGFWPAGTLFKFVEVFVNTAGTVNPNEVGLFSSPSAPNKQAQTLTRIETCTCSPITSLTIARNNTTFTTMLANDTYLWCGLRRDGAGTSPTFRGISSDMQQGHGLVVPNCPAFSQTTSFLATIAGGSEPQFADLRATMV